MALPPFQMSILRAICDILADSHHGLTGAEIGRLLTQLKIDDSQPSATKRHRLFEALNSQQEKITSGNIVGAFIQEAMNPVRYIDKSEIFNMRRDELNVALSFAGLFLRDNGRLKIVESAQTLSEAQEKANKLYAELKRRHIHVDVLRFCRAELVQNNFFHAVLEATKSLADKIRQRTHLASDGAQLVDDALGLGKNGIPLLAFNSLTTETEEMEHKGLANLLKGIFGAFRNVTAHAPKITWDIQENDALDLFSLASLLHRRLDEAINTPQQNPF